MPVAKSKIISAASAKKTIFFIKASFAIYFELIINNLYALLLSLSGINSY
jgi:hypothetical protein